MCEFISSFRLKVTSDLKGTRQIRFTSEKLQIKVTLRKKTAVIWELWHNVPGTDVFLLTSFLFASHLEGKVVDLSLTLDNSRPSSNFVNLSWGPADRLRPSSENTYIDKMVYLSEADMRTFLLISTVNW